MCRCCPYVPSCLHPLRLRPPLRSRGPPSPAQSPSHSRRVSSNVHTAKLGDHSARQRLPPLCSHSRCPSLCVGCRTVYCHSLCCPPHHCGLGRFASLSRAQSRHQTRQALQRVLVERERLGFLGETEEEGGGIRGMGWGCRGGREGQRRGAGRGGGV